MRFSISLALIVLGLVLFLLFVTVWSPCGFCGPLSMPSPPLDLQVAPFFRILGGGLAGAGVGGMVGVHRERKGRPAWP